MHRCRLALAILLAGCLLVPLAAQQPFPAYRILISNDDGVRAPGIAAVAQALQAIGTPIIVAPSSNFTGAGHSIITTQPIFREDLTLPNGLRAIGLTATPATSVNVAIKSILTTRPDLVVSGVNPGYNFGFSVSMSGTVGAARMAAMLGIPAIAVSLSEAAPAQELVFAAEEAIWVARRVKEFGLPPNTYLNVNVPPMPAGGYRGYRITTQASLRGGEEAFVETKNPQGRTVYWNVWKEGGAAPEGTDMWAVANGWVSVTPMKAGEADITPAQTSVLRQIFGSN